MHRKIKTLLRATKIDTFTYLSQNSLRKTGCYTFCVRDSHWRHYDGGCEGWSLKKQKNTNNVHHNATRLYSKYYRLQHESFCEHVKAVVDALDKILELKDKQVTDQQRAVVRELKAIYFGQLIEDIKHDLASGNVTMDTVEKRVQVDVDACKAVMDSLNLSSMGKIFLELFLADRVNAMRTNLKNQVLWMKMQNK